MINNVVKGGRGRCAARVCCCSLMTTVFLIVSIVLALALVSDLLSAAVCSSSAIFIVDSAPKHLYWKCTDNDREWQRCKHIFLPCHVLVAHGSLRFSLRPMAYKSIWA